jgi:small-conductance mechanosensitive channel
MPDVSTLLDDATRSALIVIVGQLLIIVVAAFIAIRFAGATVHAALVRLFAREAEEGTAQEVAPVELERRRKTLDELFYNGLRVIILGIAFLMALNVLRLDIGPAIAGLGVLGLALSLGAQNLVRDYVAGAFVLIENHYAEGDVVNIAGIGGAVEDINLRRTTVRSLDGTLHFVPNGLITVSSNLTRHWARVSFDMPVGYGIDVVRLRQIIDDAGKALAADPAWSERVIEPPVFVRLGDFAEYGMTATVLGKVESGAQWDATGEMRRRILDGARQAGMHLGWPVDATDTMASQTSPTLPSRRQRQ